MFLFKQKTAYELRISDWSSDVCSSDRVEPSFATGIDARGDQQDLTAPQRGKILYRAGDRRLARRLDQELTIARAADYGRAAVDGTPDGQIGRASCRERVWQYV